MGGHDFEGEWNGYTGWFRGRKGKGEKNPFSGEHKGRCLWPPVRLSGSEAAFIFETFQDKVLLCSLAWPRTQNPPASPPPKCHPDKSHQAT